MSLLKTHLLAMLYNEAQAHDIEYKSDAFWQAYLQVAFPPDEDYAVCCQWGPTNDVRHRVDVAIRQLRFDQQGGFMSTLLFCETKRHGTHPRDAEDQVKFAATKHFEADEQVQSVYGMTGWGTKARCWIIHRPAIHQRVQLVPMFGTDGRGVKAQYIDASSESARSITASINRMKGIEEPAQDSSVARASSYTVNYAQNLGF